MVAATGFAAPTAAAGAGVPEPGVALAATEVALDALTLLQELL
jgi:hypothetical protein